MKKALSTAVLIATNTLSFSSITRGVFLYPIVLMDGIGIVNSFLLMKEVNSTILLFNLITVAIVSIIFKVWNNESSKKKTFLNAVKDFLLKDSLKTYSLLTSVILFALAIGYGIILNNNASFIQLVKVILSNFSYFTYMNAVICVQLELLSFAKEVNIRLNAQMK